MVLFATMPPAVKSKRAFASRSSYTEVKKSLFACCRLTRSKDRPHVKFKYTCKSRANSGELMNEAFTIGETCEASGVAASRSIL